MSGHFCIKILIPDKISFLETLHGLFLLVMGTKECIPQRSYSQSRIEILIKKCPDIFLLWKWSKYQILGKRYGKSMKNDEILKMSEILQEICPGSQIPGSCILETLVKPSIISTMNIFSRNLSGILDPRIPHFRNSGF